MSSTRKNSQEREEKDRYPTPQWCCDGLANSIVAHLNNPTIGTLLDIGAGDGRIGRTVSVTWSHNSTSLINSQIYIDVDQPTDKRENEKWIIQNFLDVDLVSVVDLLHPTLFVSNPPFSFSDEIIEKTIEFMHSKCSEKSVAVFLQKLNWLGSGKRASFLQKHPPTRLTILSPRPSFCKKKRIGKDGKVGWTSTDSCEYAWIWWEKGKDKYDDSHLIEICINPASRFS